MNKFNTFCRKFVNLNNRRKLKNKSFSLLSSNCNGAFILHDLNLRFLSPTVNLWFQPSHFVLFLKDLDSYLRSEVDFSEELEQKMGYPVGILKNESDEVVNVYFQHYKTRDEARSKWIERAERIDSNNLFIMFTDRDGCTYQDLVNFDNLPYKNKVVFTHKLYPELKSAYYIKGFEKEESVGLCFKYKNRFTGKKYFDDFPYIRWFNGDF